MHTLRSALGQHRLLGGALVLAITQFGASLAGLIRDRALASTFPGLGVVDVYLSSFRPSDLLFQVGIISALGTVFVPLLARRKAAGEHSAMLKLLGSAMTTGSIVFGGIALVLGVLFPWIAPYFVQFEGERLALYIQFGRIALFTNFLFVFGNAAGQYLITNQRYWVYGLTPILYTLGTIAGTLLLTPFYGELGPMLGTVLGAIVYVLLRLLAVIHSSRGAWKSVACGFWHADLGEMGLLMLPRMLALGALQIQLLFFDRIASGLDAGSITINAYARNFQSVVVGIAGIAVAQSAYALLSDAAARGENARFQIYIRKALLLLLALTIPGPVALVLLSPVAARLVNVTSFLPLFTACLTIYAVSIPFESISHVLLRAYYALKNTFIPALWMIVGGITAVTTAWLFADRFGVLSLALGYTLGQGISIVGLAMQLPRKMKTKMSW